LDSTFSGAPWFLSSRNFFISGIFELIRCHLNY
jgi:hypothetical protein